MSEANELLDEIAKQPTVDEFMRRNPHTMTEDDFRQMVLAQRHERALFLTAQDKKKAKRAGVDADDEPNLEGDDNAA